MIVHHDWKSLKSRRSVSHLLSKRGGGIWAGGCALLRRLVCFSERLYAKENRFNEKKDHCPLSDPLSAVVRYHTAELVVVPLVTRHFICLLESEVLFLTAFLFCVLEWMYCFWNPLFFIDVIAIRFNSICHSVTFSIEFFFCFLTSLCLHCNCEALEWFLFSWGWKGEPFARLGSLVSVVFVVFRQKRLFCKVRELTVSHSLQGR